MPRQDEKNAARAAIGFARVRFHTGAVVLGQGQMLTLNCIAQGYIADRVARLMQSRGIGDVLIATGEIIAMGNAPSATGWPVTIAGEAQSRSFCNRALATSAPLGTVLDTAGQVGHILDPRGGTGAPLVVRQISVSAASATLADGLSTGFCPVRDSAEAERVLSKVKEARFESLYL